MQAETGPALTIAQRDTLAQVARPVRAVGRPDTLTAQHVEVAIVLHAMLGDDAAADYLKKFRVAPHVAQRILQGQRRRGSHDTHHIAP
jgi:hypothetical protein